MKIVIKSKSKEKIHYVKCLLSPNWKGYTQKLDWFYSNYTEVDNVNNSIQELKIYKNATYGINQLFSLLIEEVNLHRPNLTYQDLLKLDALL